MADPTRLRSESGSWEALLLRSAPSFEPPSSAQEEVWRRMEVVSAVVAAAGVTGIAMHAATSAGSKMVGKALWLSALKLGAVVAIGVPAVGLTARAVMHHETHATAAAATSPAVQPARARAAGGPPIDSSPSGAPAAQVAVDVPKPGSGQRAGHTAARAESPDGPSALRAESLLLGVARAKLAAGDARGALEDVARLGAQFPHGRLLQEREVLAIDCLAAMGNRQGMRTRAREFLERFAESPYSAHLRQLLDL
jgi:hypothetical protein